MTPLQNQASFRALADSTRREILQMLAARDMTVAEVSDRFDMTRAAVKKHLVTLADGGFVHVEPRGRERINRINPAGFAPVRDWLRFFDHFRDGRLSALTDAIERNDDHSTSAKDKT